MTNIGQEIPLSKFSSTDGELGFHIPTAARDQFFADLEENIYDAQTYIPIYNILLAKQEDKVLRPPRYHIIGHNKVIDLVSGTQETIPTHIKYSPLLDPIKFMMGKYDLSDPATKQLPAMGSAAGSHPKLLHTNNSSYVDGFFIYLTSTLLHSRGFVHGVDYYGSFLGQQKKFKMNVVDDLEYLEESSFFTRNLGKLFNVENPFDEAGSAPACSRQEKARLEFVGGGEELDLDFDDLDFLSVAEGENAAAVASAAAAAEPEKVYDSNSDVVVEDYDSETDQSYESTSDDSSSDNDNSSREESSDEDESEEEGDTEDNDDEDIDFIYATIYDFPVQLICTERCAGTLDELMMTGTMTENEWRAALFQVVITLAIYQKEFDFTHNDLHTNNIMWVPTEKTHIIYNFDGQRWVVPTFGRIFKIIDFGRAIYKFRGQTFCSDSFEIGGEAGGQYNFPPYFNDKHSKRMPNPAFDLCRLACSIFDMIDEEETPAVYRIIDEWSRDDFGKSVLYKKSGEERYSGFKLYKRIARDCTRTVPRTVLYDQFFAPFASAAAVSADAIEITF